MVLVVRGFETGIASPETCFLEQSRQTTTATLNIYIVATPTEGCSSVAVTRLPSSASPPPPRPFPRRHPFPALCSSTLYAAAFKTTILNKIRIREYQEAANGTASARPAYAFYLTPFTSLPLLCARKSIGLSRPFAVPANSPKGSRQPRSNPGSSIQPYYCFFFELSCRIRPVSSWTHTT